MNRTGCILVVLSLGFFSTGGAVRADVSLPGLFSDNMVIQRGDPVVVWGWAEKSEYVFVKLVPHRRETHANSRGWWRVELPSLEAEGPLELIVRGKNLIRFTNVRMGEVWICAGQTNMRWPVQDSAFAEREIPAADFPHIRFFRVPERPRGQPGNDVDAAWLPCSPETVKTFSAVAYYFGREVHRQLNVPVGLIQATWEDARIEPWIPPQGFQSVPSLHLTLKEMKEAVDRYESRLGPALDPFENWVGEARRALAENKPIPLMPACPKHPLDSPHEPTGLYNGMIHPLIPYGKRGVIWYQGEQNVGDGPAYLDKMKALIQGWRSMWGGGDFPFYYVQVSPYTYGGIRPTEEVKSVRDPCRLPLFWEIQAAVLALPNTGMVVTTDIGDLWDFHPRNKQEVGRRLSLWALARTYGKNLVYSGPVFRSLCREEGRIRIHFDHIGGGLTTRDDKPPDWFEVAGKDDKYVKAQTLIDGVTVLAWSDAVDEPVAIRFGWHQEAQPNLMNREGLPAPPFRASLGSRPVKRNGKQD